MQQGLMAEMFKPRPVGPLGLVAMEGCETLGNKVNDYLVKWEYEPENADQVLSLIHI